MNRTSARCVIAHSERLKRVMVRLPLISSWQAWSMPIDGADPLAGVELLHPKRDDAFAVADARSDKGRIGGEGRNRHRAHLQFAGLVDDVHRRTRAAIEDG